MIPEEALEHFTTIFRSEASREQEKAEIAANKTRSQFIQAGAGGGSRMHVAVGQNFASHLITLREFIEAAVVNQLKPHAQRADRETLVKLREGVLKAFDLATSSFREALRRYAGLAARFGGTGADASGEEVFKGAAARERDALQAALALSLSPPSGSDHRLAAVLATDVVGFSTLVAADEKAALEAVSASMTALSEAVGRHGGRLVKTTGDGSLSEFESAVGAMEAALEIQRTSARQNAGRPEDKRVVLRIGLAVGDVSPDGDDIMGDAVNLAARLEALAAPGTIATLEHVRDDLVNKLALASADLGQRQLKGIGRTVRVVQITPK